MLTGLPLIPVLRLKGSPCLNINYYFYYLEKQTQIADDGHRMFE